MDGLNLHDGSAQLIGRQDLLALTTPEPTPPHAPTHVPIPHSRFVEAIIESLGYRDIKVVKDEYAVGPGKDAAGNRIEGARLFGFMRLNIEHAGIQLALGLRNSHDRSMSLALVAGYSVFVCSNMAFRGAFSALTKKHTKNVDLAREVSIGVDQIQRNFEKTKIEVDAWRDHSLPDSRAKEIIYNAFIGGDLDVPKHLAKGVHDRYFYPDLAYCERPEEAAAFTPRTLWSLSNAFTSAFKVLDPVPQFKATAALGTYLETVN